MVAGEVLSFLALSALTNEEPILTGWRPGADIHELELAMVGGIKRV